MIEKEAEGAKRGSHIKEGIRAVRKIGGLLVLVAGAPGCNTWLWKTSNMLILYTQVMQTQR